MEGLGCWTSEVEQYSGLFSDQLMPNGFPTLSLLVLLDERRAYLDCTLLLGRGPGGSCSGSSVAGQTARGLLALDCLLPLSGKRGDSRPFGAGVQEDPTPSSHLVCGGRCIGLLRFCCYCCGQINLLLLADEKCSGLLCRLCCYCC